MSDDDKRDPTRWVEIEHEHYIPLPPNRMIDVLCSRMPEEKHQKKFRKIACVLHLLIKHQYHELCEQLKSTYEIFDPVNASHPFDLPDDEVKAREDAFLDSFLTVMEKANFSLLSAEELESAQAADYMFTLPIEITYENLDDVMLKRFLASHDWGGKGDLPSFANHVLLFKRGAGIDKTEQVLTFDKVDQWIVRGWTALKAKINKMRGKEEASPAAPLTMKSNTEDNVTSSIHATKFVERINLQTMDLKFPTSFYTATPMQEPTYDRIIILYRPKVAEVKGNIQPIYIKQFKHIPMADLDVVFPDKRVHMTTLDRLIFGIGIVLGLYLIISELFSLIFPGEEVAEDDGGAWGFVAVLMSVGVLISKSVVSYQTAKERYHSLVTSSLYEKNMDSDRGVFFYLINSLEEQELMETILGYFGLWEQGQMNESQLDEYCEQLLTEAFGAEVDFEVGDSLDKLVKFKMVDEEATGSFKAVSLRDAHSGLYDKWCSCVPKPHRKKKSSSKTPKKDKKDKSSSTTNTADDITDIDDLSQ